MYEYLQGKKSPWYRYLEVMPSASEFNTLMYWSDSELDELQASAVRNKIGKASADELFRAQVLPVIEKHGQVFYPEDVEPLSSQELLELAHRMGSTIMAYAFDLEPAQEVKEVDEEGFESDDDDDVLPKGMLPMADMLNADADSNAKLVNGPELLTMTASTPIGKGGEILNDYGPLPRSDLLRRYGYITKDYAKFDVVEISHDMVLQHIKQLSSLAAEDLSKRLEYLDEADMIDQGYDVEGSLEDAENHTVRIQDELLHVLRTLLAEGGDYKKLHKMPESQQEHLMSRVGRTLHGILKSRVGQYSTTTDEDEAILAQETLSHRYRMAVEVRLGEKKLLNNAMALATYWASSHKFRPDDANDRPALKKQKTC